MPKRERYYDVRFIGHIWQGHEAAGHTQVSVTEVDWCGEVEDDARSYLKRTQGDYSSIDAVDVVLVERNTFYSEQMGWECVTTMQHRKQLVSFTDEQDDAWMQATYGAIYAEVDVG